MRYDDAHMERDMHASVAILNVKRAWDTVSVLIADDAGHPGPRVWTALIELGKAIDDLYTVGFIHADS